MRSCHLNLLIPTRLVLIAWGFFLLALAGQAFAAPSVPAIDPTGLPGPLVIAGGNTQDARQASC